MSSPTAAGSTRPGARPARRLLRPVLTAAALLTCALLAAGCSFTLPGSGTEPPPSATSASDDATASAAAPGDGAGETDEAGTGGASGSVDVPVTLGGPLTSAPGTRLIGTVETTSGDDWSGWHATLMLEPGTDPGRVLQFYRRQLTTAGFTVDASGLHRVTAFAPVDPDPSPSAPSAPDTSGADPAGAGDPQAASAASSVPVGTYVDVDVVPAAGEAPGYVRVIFTAPGPTR